MRPLGYRYASAKGRRHGRCTPTMIRVTLLVVVIPCQQHVSQYVFVYPHRHFHVDTYMRVQMCALLVDVRPSPLSCLCMSMCSCLCTRLIRPPPPPEFPLWTMTTQVKPNTKNYAEICFCDVCMYQRVHMYASSSISLCVRIISINDIATRMSI